MTILEEVKIKYKISKDPNKDLDKILTRLYFRMHFSASRKERPKKIGRFSKKQFFKWAIKNNIYSIYEDYVKSNYLQSKKPSVDRINPKKGYYFYNMQIITQEQNFKKGRKEIPLLLGKSVLQISKDGKVIQKFPSVATAYKMTGISDGNIWSVIKKRRNYAGGYLWSLYK